MLQARTLLNLAVHIPDDHEHCAFVVDTLNAADARIQAADSPGSSVGKKLG